MTLSFIAGSIALIAGLVLVVWAIVEHHQYRSRDIQIRPAKPALHTFEYFCWGCGQLRLSFADVISCGHCGSEQITPGPVGSLDRESLKARWQGLTDPQLPTL